MRSPEYWRLGRENVLFPQDRHLTLDQQPRTLVRYGDDALADDEAFAGLNSTLRASHLRVGWPRSFLIAVNEGKQK